MDLTAAMLDGSIHLHARNISFTHPVNNQITTITAPPPNEVLWNECIKKIDRIDYGNKNNHRKPDDSIFKRVQPATY